MDEDILRQLFELAEPSYQQFTARLLPGVENIIGVRLPKLRKIARQLSKEDWQTYLKEGDEHYFEQIMLKGMVIGLLQKEPIEDVLELVSHFVPKIKNWSVCDSFCSGLKITKQNREMVWEYLKPYFHSVHEYEVRFAVVMLIAYYIDEDYIERVLIQLDHITHKGYYVQMAVAWAVSICFLKQESQTMAYLKQNQLDDFTYNKALQKIIESLKVKPEVKEMMRDMKR